MPMEAVIAERPGKLSDVLAFQPIDAPGILSAGEVAVRMLASTVNPSDAVTVSGAYGSRTQFPCVPGFEGVGVIERVGPGVSARMVGRRVLPIGSAGNWQQIKRIENSWCTPVPEDITDAVACFAYINPLTALLMIERYCAGPVRSVAVTAATSTIAGHLAELLAARGLHPVGLTRGTFGRTPAHPELWSEIVNANDPDWQERLGKVAGAAGFDVVLDCVGGAQGAALMGTLRSGGVLVHYGLLSGEPLPAECFTGHDDKRVEMFRLRDVIHAYPREDLPFLFEPVFAHLRAGRLRTQIAHHVPLATLPQTLKKQAGTGRGKPLISYAR